MAFVDESEFPCSITIETPFPDHRLAMTALSAIQVDAEISPLVRRKLSLVSPLQIEPQDPNQDSILRTEYRATTNRMLRVAVNGYMESLSVVLEVMQELDVDVLESQSRS